MTFPEFYSGYHDVTRIQFVIQVKITFAPDDQLRY